jgi:hypothetical protein
MSEFWDVFADTENTMMDSAGSSKSLKFFSLWPTVN